MSQTVGGYGYSNDEEQISSVNIGFGLNAGKTFLKKFEFIPNGGKDGAEQQALDIIFDVNGTEKSYRMFPVTQAYGKNNVVITDSNSPEMKQAYDVFNGIITHILSAFRSKEDIQAGFQAGRPQDFQSFCTVAKAMLPANFSTIALDSFFQYQYSIKGTNTRTFLELPTKMKYGKWLVPAQTPFNADGSAGSWTEHRKENPSATDGLALMYLDGKGNVHPFTRNGWFVNSPYSNQILEEDENTPAAPADGSAIAGAPTANAPAKPEGW